MSPVPIQRTEHETTDMTDIIYSNIFILAFATLHYWMGPIILVVTKLMDGTFGITRTS